MYLVPTPAGCLQLAGDLAGVSSFLLSQGLIVEPYVCVHSVLEADELCWPCEHVRERVRRTLQGRVIPTCVCGCADTMHNARGSAVRVDDMPWWEGSMWVVYSRGGLVPIVYAMASGGKFSHTSSSTWCNEDVLESIEDSVQSVFREYEIELRNWLPYWKRFPYKQV